VRTPLIVHWPAGIPTTVAGEVRDQFCHAVDLLPTVLDGTGVAAPAVVDGVGQLSFDGASLRATFVDDAAPTPHDTQYFETLGSRSIVHDGWKATTDHVGAQLTVEQQQLPGSRDYDTDRWCLFDLATDFAEAHDVADAHPERAAELERLWWTEAGRNSVLPLDDSLIGRAVALERPPRPLPRRAVLRPGGGGVVEDAVPSLVGGFSMAATVEVAAAASGIVCALGDWSNGLAWFLRDGRPAVAVSTFGTASRAESPVALSAGCHVIGLRYRRGDAGGGPLQLVVDGAPVAEVTLPEDLPFRWQIGGAVLRVGRDSGFPVSDDYEPPFPFRGLIESVIVESGPGELVELDAAGHLEHGRRAE
jgi:arylsulfatase